jgi:cell division protein FtsW
VLVWRGFVIARRAEKFNRRFRAYLCYGLTACLGMQALINMAVNMGLLPTKGLTLPLISYGGSSLMTVFVMLGLVLRVDHENRLEAAGQPSGAYAAKQREHAAPKRASRRPAWDPRQLSFFTGDSS